ncbi:MAG TPA: hypothetical protein VM600_09570 [Actinomycetota bacterium]|nr:hypothetical protein [Actinomycetota bacterium]
MIARVGAALVAFVLTLPLSASAAPDTPLVSGNVTLVGSLPDVPAIGGSVREITNVAGMKRRYFVMTTLRGISVYDTTVPEAPVLSGHLELPHIENEDVDFGDEILIVSVDPSFVQRSELAGLYIIDISKLPAITFAYVNPATGNRFTPATADGEGHTATCVAVPDLPKCSWVYVNGDRSVSVVDLRVPAHPRLAGRWNSNVGSTHDAQVDDAGLFWMVGSGGLAAYDTKAPTAPRLVAGPHRGGLNYHHNSLRPRASQWAPRGAEMDDPAVRPGETVLVSEEEIYDQVACDRQGRFQTRWFRDADAIGSGQAARIDTLDTWTTELQLAGVAAPAPVCSSHYFTERNNIVAVAWYNQGTRFLDISDPRDIRQVGYYIMPSTSVWSTQWVGEGTAGGEIVYTMDATRGIDILRFDRASEMPTVTAPILPQWLNASAMAATARPHPTWGWACRIPVAG